jgi:hypothetical protein
VAQLRASDADRERTVAALRHHASVGRLTVEELAERSERAYTAATVSELAVLQTDLPSLATRPIRRAHGLAPGWRAFTSRWHTPVRADDRPRFVGWFALLHKEMVRITIDVAETDRGTQVVASGVAPLPLRRTFAELGD